MTTVPASTHDPLSRPGFFRSRDPITRIQIPVSDHRQAICYLDPDDERVATVSETLRSLFDEDRVTVETDLETWREYVSQSLDCLIVGREEAAASSAVPVVDTLTDATPVQTVILLADPESPEVVEAAYRAGADHVVQYTGEESVPVLERHLSPLSPDRDEDRTVPPQPHLRELLAATEDAIITIDTESRIHYATSGIEEILGYEPEALVGESLTKLMPDAAIESHMAGIDQYLETGEPTIDWSDVELVGQHRDGHNVPLSVSMAAVTVEDELFFTGIVRDISERNERETRLSRYEAMVQTVDDGIFALDETGRFVAVNDAYTELLGYDREDIIGEAATTVVDDRVHASAERLQAHLEGSDQKAGTLETTLQTADGEVVPVEARLSLFPLEDGATGRVGVVRDISERRQHTERLALLNEVGQALTRATTATEVADVVVESAQEMLGLPISAVELYDEDSGRLESITRSEATDRLVDDDALFAATRNVPWRVFTTNDSKAFDDLRASGVSEEETPLRSAIVLPIGPHGVFVTGATEPNAFDRAEHTIANILASNARAAFDRVEREAELRDQKERLQARNDSLERVERINGVIRDITQSLTQATSREEIESAVCSELADSGPYAFCWIAERQSVTGDRLTPRTAAGSGEDYLEQVVTDGDLTPESPVARAIETTTTQVQNTLHSDPPFDPWRVAALDRDFRSSIAVPIAYREKSYGALELFADETGTFGDLEAAVLEELGEMVGYAVNAMERKKMLVSDTAVALEFEIADPDIPAIEFVQETGGTFELDELVQQANGRYRVFFTISGVDPEAVYEFGDHVQSVSDLTFIGETDDAVRFEADVGESGFLGQLLSYGVYPKEMSAAGDVGRLEVELPRSGDIQSVIQLLLDSYESAELVARQERDRPVQTREAFEATYREVLTARQEEVIKTAYFSGFFEWPREKTGQEIAAMLDVSQPTINRHIRTSQRKLFDLLFDDR